MELFWNKVEIRGLDDCWLWLGCKSSNGYGKFQFRGKQEGAHRVAFMLGVGEIGKDLYVLHKCDMPLCVNPAHLFLGTTQDNTADKKAKGRCSTVKLFGDKNGMYRGLRQCKNNCGRQSMVLRLGMCGPCYDKQKYLKRKLSASG